MVAHGLMGAASSCSCHRLRRAPDTPLVCCLPVRPNRVFLSSCVIAGVWSDTPDSACLAALDQLERAAGAGRAGPAAAGVGGSGGAGAGDSPAPARQLSFTPSAGASRAVAAAMAGTPPVAAGGLFGGVAAAASTPLSSSGGRAQARPTSHLGRSALLQAAAEEWAMAATRQGSPAAAAAHAPWGCRAARATECLRK